MFLISEYSHIRRMARSAENQAFAYPEVQRQEQHWIKATAPPTRQWDSTTILTMQYKGKRQRSRGI